jgi:hypothetical protein
MSEEDGTAVLGRFDESMSVKGATTKATRERQRRIRLNDRWVNTKLLGNLLKGWISVQLSDLICAKPTMP